MREVRDGQSQFAIQNRIPLKERLRRRFLTHMLSFHIPFQSGSNELLVAMGRGHTREKYLHIVDRIRTVSDCPDVCCASGLRTHIVLCMTFAENPRCFDNR
jgi:hypothetical protein